ncbi:MAG TPA: aldo/keto reductase [Chthonomonadales bacterium]|nr:aldo/keto reductase [Chthonomonadales bacterium]
MSLSRRRFLRDAAVAAGGIAGAAAAVSAEPAAPALARRMLGRTRWRASIIGFGLAPLGSDNSPPDFVERTVGWAIDQGINVLDVAPNYGSIGSRYGNAETKLKGVLQQHRRRVFLATKVNAGRPDRDGVQRQLEESLQRMGVGQVDAVHIHNLGDFDMEQLLRPDGGLAGLKAARSNGLTRFIAVSGHSRPARFTRLIDTGEIDLTMVVLNFADRINYDFDSAVLPVARKHRTGVMAMKVLGGTKRWSYDGRTQAVFSEHRNRAIRYSLGLPGVSCAVIGFNSIEEVQGVLDVVRPFRPLSAADRTALLAEGKQIAAQRGQYYGPTTG